MAKEETKTPEKKSNKKLIVIIAVVVAVLIGLTLLGRYIAKKVAEKAASSFLSGVTGQNVNIGGGGSLPADFPKDFPVYTGAKVTGSFSTSGTGNDRNAKGISVVWETGDDAAKVGAYYKSQLPAAGYTVTTDYSAGDTTTLTFEKGSVSGFMGVTKGEGGKTAISVTIGTK